MLAKYLMVKLFYLENKILKFLDILYSVNFK